MKFLSDTDIQYFYNLNSDARYGYPIFLDMPNIETTFEVRKQNLKLKDVIH